VHIQVLQVVVLWLFVLFCGQADQTLLVHEDSQRIYAIQEHIDSQIKLQAIKKEGITNILLGYKVFIG
jgi:hypothetical protein